MTASFGLTQALPGEMSTRAMIDRADAAMCRAKEEGRNCVRIVDEGSSPRPEGRNPGVTQAQT